MKKILPPSRPKRDNAAIDAVLEHYKVDRDKPCLVFIRSYYLNTMGEEGRGDQNIYDDACYLISPRIRESYNANTEPSFKNKGKATLNLGKYLYYRGKHKGKYNALRPFPEGVILKCTRDGQPSTCSHTNIHRGGSRPSGFDVVWSEGCLTIPSIQYEDFITRVYAEMKYYKIQTIEVLLVENRQTSVGQQLFDEKGAVI